MLVYAHVHKNIHINTSIYILYIHKKKGSLVHKNTHLGNKNKLTNKLTPYTANHRRLYSLVQTPSQHNHHHDTILHTTTLQHTVHHNTYNYTRTSRQPQNNNTFNAQLLCNTHHHNSYEYIDRQTTHIYHTTPTDTHLYHTPYLLPTTPTTNAITITNMRLGKKIKKS